MHDLDVMLQLQINGKHKQAREISDKLEKMGPEKMVPANPSQTKQEIWTRHCFNRGWFLLQEGKYSEGCQLLEYGRMLDVYGNGKIPSKFPIFNPKEHNPEGKSILISVEGGFGDEIIQAKFAASYKKLGAKKVYIRCNTSLVSLFERIDGVDGVFDKFYDLDKIEHDYWIPGFSAGWLAGHEFGENFPNKPYLTAKKESVDMWKSFFDSSTTNNKLKVGVRWAGNPKFEHQQHRRFPEEFLVNLAQYDELKIFSLQRDHNLTQLPDNVTDLQHLMISWEDTAAIIMNLDLVITSCTSIAHLAAALGKETWVITPILPYHTWTHGAPESNKSDFYECVTVFRQKEYKKWNETFQELYESLEKKYNLKHVDLPDEDKRYISLNLGCGFEKQEGYLNVDESNFYKPDLVLDLNQTPWPWKDNQVDHMVLNNVLHKLGDSKEDFLNIMKEMYRVTCNGGIWEIKVPHWRYENTISDLDFKRNITPGLLNSFNKQLSLNMANKNMKFSTIPLEHDIDIEIQDVQLEYIDPIKSAVNGKLIDDEQLSQITNHMSNTIMHVKYLVQVFKPSRIDNKEFDFLLK